MKNVEAIYTTSVQTAGQRSRRMKVMEKTASNIFHLDRSVNKVTIVKNIINYQAENKKKHYKECNIYN